MKRLTAAVIFCLVLTVSFSEPRNALLIANGNYANFAGLKNPIPEANALADSLRQLGFNVTVKTDLSKEQMEDCLYDFQLTLQSSGGTAFFHYGGMPFRSTERIISFRRMPMCLTNAVSGHAVLILMK